MISRHPIFHEVAVLVILGGALAQYLPAIASALAIWWYCVMLWESRTGAWWRSRWRAWFRWGTEDKVLAITLGLGGVGVALGLVAVSILMR